MKLSEFIKKRKEELKLTWHDFADAGLGSQTMHNLNNDKQVSIKPVTKEKLATVLQCSQGDIQACLAEMNPLKKSGYIQEVAGKTETSGGRYHEGSYGGKTLCST